MKYRLFCIFVVFFIVTSCVSRHIVYFQNRTNSDIQIYQTITYDIPENDSLMKIVMQQNNLHSNIKHYYKVLKPDSLAFLDIVYGKKSKTELVDSNSNYFNSSLVIVSNNDTTLFTQKEIIRKINEAWVKKNSNSSVKLKVHEKNRLIWEFRDDFDKTK